MADAFRTRIRHALADLNLQSALDANAERRIKVRLAAFESLDHPEVLRSRAHQVREDVIAHLESYLEQFITHAQENGILVHRARDAQDAVHIILKIAEQHGVKNVAKSKTMVSEEIELNHALETHGIQVIETDLGEYIVQLRGEAPSHIITPAVHLRRQDVGKLFEEKLRIAYTEDISTMTNTARQILRRVFLDADLGISGVNFGVAETGTLCVVTNEGNGRMVTTLPQVHVALMGIERIVPTMDDLALMLSLLPRSATGQKLSVYTSLINRPRGIHDPDGPQERHVVLVDNGRLAARESALREILYCIRCGACLNACPVFREIGGHAYVAKNGMSTPYPGPMGSVVSPALFGHCEFGHLARASSLCGACKEACPVDIDLPRLLLKIRAGIGSDPIAMDTKPNAPWALSLGLRLFALAGKSPRRFILAQRLAGIGGSIVSLFSRDDPWMHLPAISGWGFSKDFPRPAMTTFRSRYLAMKHATPDETLTRQAGETNRPANSQSVQTLKMNDEDKLKIFIRELEALGGKCYLSQAENIDVKILEILGGNNLNEILAWDRDRLPNGLLEKLSKAGIKILFPSTDTIEASSHVRAGITGSSAAIASTGSLLLVGGPGRPLTASLLPEIHIALVRQKDLYTNLTEAFQNEQIMHAPASVLISGPSRTADIEMTLTIGVHGPGELHVICIAE
jgi:L-lactate dehydrogenase complex protein LldF